MSFKSDNYSDCFDQAEYIYLSTGDDRIRAAAQIIMRLVEDANGQMRAHERRVELGLAKSGVKP